MRKWFRNHIQGYVVARIYGVHAGRFFNLCAKNKISVWNIRSYGENEYQCFLSANQVWEVHPYLRKTGCRIRILKKHGMPFTLFQYRKRILFPISLCFVIFLFGYCSQFIWKIEVHGNSYLTEETIIAYLKEEECGFGTAIREIDSKQLKMKLREDFPQIIWSSVAIEGTNLIIEVQERINQDSASEEAQADALQTSGETREGSYDLIAEKDAVVDAIITRSGTPLVKKGEAVQAGSVLVRGRQEILDDNGEVKEFFPACADADIIGITMEDYHDSIPVSQTRKLYRKQSPVSVEFCVGTKQYSFPFVKQEEQDADYYQTYYQLHLNRQFYLPLALAIGYECEYEKETYSLSKDEALALAQNNLRRYLALKEEEGAVVLQTDLQMKQSGEEYVVSGTIQLKENIGRLVREQIPETP